MRDLNFGCLGWVVILVVIVAAALLKAAPKGKCPACKSRDLRPPRPGTVTVIAEGEGWALLRCACCGAFVKTPISGRGYEMAREHEVPPDLRGTR